MRYLQVPKKEVESAIPEQEQDAELTPLEVAEKFKEASRRVKTAQSELARAQEDLAPWKSRMLDLIENGELPKSFTPNSGGNIHMTSQLWASPKEGNHDRLTQVLQSLGLKEYLPKTVNSQSLSAYVREFRDELGQVKIGTVGPDGQLSTDGLDPRLADILNLTEKFDVKATGT
jgi:hypothetical protein